MQVRSSFLKPQITAGPPVTPDFAWYDPSDPANYTAVAHAIATVLDKTGNGHTLTASGGPVDNNGTIGGLTAISMDTDSQLITANLTLAQPFTITFVLKAGAGGHNFENFLKNSAGVVLGGSGGKWSFYAGSNVQAPIDPAIDSTAHVITLVANGSSSHLRQDGAQTWVAGAGGSNPGSADYSAEPMAFGDSGGALIGLYGEIFVSTGAMSDVNAALNEAWLKAKWGTP